VRLSYVFLINLLTYLSFISKRELGLLGRDFILDTINFDPGFAGGGYTHVSELKETSEGWNTNNGSKGKFKNSLKWSNTRRKKTSQ